MPGAQLHILAAGAWHREGQAHCLELLGGGLVVTDVHEPGDEVLVHLPGEQKSV